MTTVAVRDGIMAADSQLSGSTVFRVQKIYELPGGGCVGGCGEWAKAYSAISWLLGGRQGDAPDFENAELVILKPDGSVWLACERFPEFPILDGVAAIGCGSAAAMALMHAGFSAKEAVVRTCLTDPGSSQPVQVYKLPRKRKKDSSNP